LRDSNTTDNDTAHIIGLDVLWAQPCFCGCPKTRVEPHSKVSDLLIWRCPWCKRRRGKVADCDANKLKAFAARFGWTMLPLIFHEDGGCYVR
jgi:hypothetical protein